jgi:ankyrin repeat protein
VPEYKGTAAIEEALKRNQERSKETHKQAIQQKVATTAFAIHQECRHQCRSFILLQYVALCPQALAAVDEDGYLPLHLLLSNKLSSIDDALIMIEKFPAALQHQTNSGQLPLHIECERQCRSIIITKCIELYPEALAKADNSVCLPLHILLLMKSSSIDAALLMIEKYPAALVNRNNDGWLPLHLECMNQRRLAILSKCIDQYPEALSKNDLFGYLPLVLLSISSYTDEYGYSFMSPHKSRSMKPSSTDDVLMMIEMYPEALHHPTNDGWLPLHLECDRKCRLPIISKSIELYPESLGIADTLGMLPMHWLLERRSSSDINNAIMMIEKYPAALKHRDRDGHRPLFTECANQSRSTIVSKCIDKYPEALDDEVISALVVKVNKSNFRVFADVLSIIFTASPMSLYRYHRVGDDIRDDPYYRRRILNLLPRHIFTPILDADYRDLNWQPRTTMMMLLSQMKRLQSRKQLGSSLNRNENAAA